MTVSMLVIQQIDDFVRKHARPISYEERLLQANSMELFLKRLPHEEKEHLKDMNSKTDPVARWLRSTAADAATSKNLENDFDAIRKTYASQPTIFRDYIAAVKTAQRIRRIIGDAHAASLSDFEVLLQGSISTEKDTQQLLDFKNYCYPANVEGFVRYQASSESKRGLLHAALRIRNALNIRELARLSTIDFDSFVKEKTLAMQNGNTAARQNFYLLKTLEGMHRNEAFAVVKYLAGPDTLKYEDKVRAERLLHKYTMELASQIVDPYVRKKRELKNIIPWFIPAGKAEQSEKAASKKYQKKPSFLVGFFSGTLNGLFTVAAGATMLTIVNPDALVDIKNRVLPPVTDVDTDTGTNVAPKPHPLPQWHRPPKV